MSLCRSLYVSLSVYVCVESSAAIWWDLAELLLSLAVIHIQTEGWTYTHTRIDRQIRIDRHTRIDIHIHTDRQTDTDRQTHTDRQEQADRHRPRQTGITLSVYTKSPCWDKCDSVYASWGHKDDFGGWYPPSSSSSSSSSFFFSSSSFFSFSSSSFSYSTSSSSSSLSSSTYSSSSFSSSSSSCPAKMSLTTLSIWSLDSTDADHTTDKLKPLLFCNSRASGTVLLLCLSSRA